MNTNEPLSELRCENQWQLVYAMINGVEHLIPNSAPVLRASLDRLMADHMRARSEAEQFAIDLDRESMLVQLHRAESERLAEMLDDFNADPGPSHLDRDMRTALLTQLENLQANNVRVAELIGLLS